MRKREFGRTGLQVSEIVFGCGFVGGLMIFADDDTAVEVEEQRARQALARLDARFA